MGMPSLITNATSSHPSSDVDPLQYLAAEGIAQGVGVPREYQLGHHDLALTRGPTLAFWHAAL